MKFLFKKLKIFILLIKLVKIYPFNHLDVSQPSSSSVNLEDCDICKLLTNSFSNGLSKTERGKFEGGNSNWEESRLKNYADSELRLTEIQELLCSDLKDGKHQCLSLAAKTEEEIEHWWFNEKEKKFKLFDFLCVDKLKYCCLEGLYGPNCDKCVGYPNNICNQHGKCNGSGTRKGDGTCNCNIGYTGQNCSSCDKGFLLEKEKCLSCDASCEDDCTDLSSKGCLKCKEGFELVENEGCVDINECLIPEKNKTCFPGTYCKNNYGTFSCLDCDKVCKTCFNNGPESCLECTKGYEKENGICKHYQKTRNFNNNEIFKYISYVLITILSCILMKKRPLISLLIVICLSIYIGLREYAIQKSLDSVIDVLEQYFL